MHEQSFPRHVTRATQPKQTHRKAIQYLHHGCLTAVGEERSWQRNYQGRGAQTTYLPNSGDWRANLVHLRPTVAHISRGFVHKPNECGELDVSAVGGDTTDNHQMSGVGLTENRPVLHILVMLIKKPPPWTAALICVVNTCHRTRQLIRAPVQLATAQAILPA